MNRPRAADELRPICVIVAARNAERTIGRAVRSALLQAEVGELVVVDDASEDGTAAAARSAAAGDERLNVLRLETNRGPSAARNFALHQSTLPFVSILDADDFFLPGRFEPLLQSGDWDLIADNIAFIPPELAAVFDSELIPEVAPEVDWLDLEAFVIGNISKRSAPRGETGFLKPVIRRAFLDAAGLHYDERLRLGEDFILYASMLAHDARFAVTRRCGYVALERPDSLSGRHSADDLAALAAADADLLRQSGLPERGGRALARHRRHILAKHAHRAFLAEKRSHGFLPALARASSSPSKLWTIAAAILADKVQALRPATSSPLRGGGGPRFLFDLPSVGRS